MKNIKISEDFQGRSEYFAIIHSYTNKSKYSLRVKDDISEATDILNCMSDDYFSNKTFVLFVYNLVKCNLTKLTTTSLVVKRT